MLFRLARVAQELARLHTSSFSSSKVSLQRGTMATVTPTSVKDVPRDKFIAAYAEHLKANDKVRLHLNVLVLDLIAGQGEP